MCRLKVVLFANGRGADASTYKPNRDDSQWWNRRDALVRCVAAFLFGPEVDVDADHRELVILYDDDLSRMHMTYRQPGSSSADACQCLIPSEQNIVSLWKQAASQENGEPVERSGLTCRLVASRKSSESRVSGMDSKRDVLEFLQKVCSLDFLRHHGLNSSPAVILRKTNKKTLMNVWSAWKQKEISKESAETSTETLESILEELLQPDSPVVEQVVAGVLHESSENELPCWEKDSRSMPSMQICLFLGAVRDMSSTENRCLERLCDRLSIPLAKVRLGPVPEFTSKILTVTAVHHAQGTLAPAIHTLIESKDKSHKRLREEEAPPSTSTLATTVPLLHFICLVPIASSELSTELSDRTRALWCLVRCTVASLWRSRLVGQGGISPLSNHLTLVFEDGQAVTFQQDELVTSLAEQHQAAPSENQILKALQAKLEKVATSAVQDWKTRAVAILNGLMVADNMTKPRYILNTEAKGNDDLFRLFCDMDPEHASDTNDSAWVLVSIGPRSTALEDMETSVLRACRKMKVPVIHRPVLSSSCQDREAATITMIQHFSYQNRLFGMLRRELDSASQTSSKKKKKRSS
jgi:hypothetical protein